MENQDRKQNEKVTSHFIITLRKEPVPTGAGKTYGKNEDGIATRTPDKIWSDYQHERCGEWS